MLPMTEMIVAASGVVLVALCGVLAGAIYRIAHITADIDKNTQETVCLLRTNNRLLALLLEQRG